MSNVITVQIGGSIALVLQPPSPAIVPQVTARFAGFTVTAKGDHVAYTLPADQMVVVKVTYVDASNNPAVVDGAVTWDSSDASVASVAVDANDSTQCTISAPGKLGSAQVTATADADLGTGVNTLVTTLDVTVVAGEAVAGTISPVGPPQPIPPT